MKEPTTGQTFKDYLAEQMRDPEFRAAYEQISAEEDARLAQCQPQPNTSPLRSGGATSHEGESLG